jgi:peptide/nickel transport system permease protein
VARVILHRLLIAVPVLALMSMLTFVLASLVPGDTAQALLGQGATADQVEKLREELGLNDSLLAQYWRWLTDLAHGSLGQSLLNNEPVTQILNSRVSVTLVLVVGTTLLASLIGVGLGLTSAIRGGVLGKLVDVLALLGSAFPSFWIGLGLVSLFAVTWEVFPPNGYTPFSLSPSQWAQYLVLPITALAIHAMTTIAIQTRDSVLEVLSRDFVRVQFANGYSRRSILFKHVLRNASTSIITVIGIVFVQMLSGAVIIEVVFTLPGLGQEVVSATIDHDIPVVQGAVLYFTVAVLAVNLLIDVLYSWVDPRVRVR